MLQPGLAVLLARQLVHAHALPQPAPLAEHAFHGRPGPFLGWALRRRHGSCCGGGGGDRRLDFLDVFESPVVGRRVRPVHAPAP